LSAADLGMANVKDIEWKEIASVKGANIQGVKSAPDGFIAWALANGAVQNP
jgi:hypothetical protein